MDTKQKVANRIKMTRKARGMTQEDLADAIDRSVETVSSLERGKSFPNLVTFERLSEALNVPIRDFFDFVPGAVPGKESKRDKALADAVAVLNGLIDPDLTVALEQLKALAKRSSQTGQ